MGGDVSDTSESIAVEINSVVEHLQKSSEDFTVKVNKSTKTLLAKLKVPVKGSGNTITVNVGNALSCLVKKFHSECNEKKTKQHTDDYRYEVENAIQNLLEACLESKYSETYFFPVLSRRYGAFFKDYVECTKGHRPLEKLKEWGRITSPMSTSEEWKYFPIFVVIEQVDDQLPAEMVEDDAFQEQWEFLTGKEVKTLFLLTVQTGD
jgi:hypothetical protein